MKGMEPGDLDLFNKFMIPREDDVLSTKDGPIDERDRGINLADLILERIVAHEAAQSRDQVSQSSSHFEDTMELPAKVVEVYSKYVCLLVNVCLSSLLVPEPWLKETQQNWSPALSIQIGKASKALQNYSCDVSLGRDFGNHKT